MQEDGLGLDIPLLRLRDQSQSVPRYQCKHRKKVVAQPGSYVEGDLVDFARARPMPPSWF
jgi:hypothetical protein